MLDIVAKQRVKLKEEVADQQKRIDALGQAMEKGESIPAEKKSEISEGNKRIEALTHEIKDLETSQGVLRTAAEFTKDWNDPVNRGDQDVKKLEEEQKAKSIRPTQVVMNDTAFKSWREAGANGGSPIVTIEGFGKSLITGLSDTSAGAFVVTERDNELEQGTFRKQLTLLDLIPKATTQSDTIDFVREVGFTNTAAEVLEATSVSTGAAPESSYSLEVVQIIVQEIKHFLPVTRRALQDAGQIQSLIEDVLRYGLAERLNTQMLNGDGISPNIRGILNASGISTQAYSTSLHETLLKGRTKVRIQGKTSPNAYLLNPQDNESLLLTKDGENKYYFGGPTAYGVQTVWGLPVVEEEAQAAGAGLVADFRRAKLYLRENATLRVAEQHSDWFTKGIVALMAEMRGALAVRRPSAFCTLDLTP